MENSTFMIGAHVQKRLGAEREIVVSRPNAPAWRADLPALLDQLPGSGALVEYVVKLYARQLPLEAELTGWETLTTVVRLAIAGANGEQTGE